MKLFIKQFLQPPFDFRPLGLSI